MRTADFDFHLPAERIAQTAIEPRDHARLLHVAPQNAQRFTEHHVYDLPDLLRTGDILVLNNTRVIPARLYGFRANTKVEVLLHQRKSAEPSLKSEQIWKVFARPGKKLRVGDVISFTENFSAEVISKGEGGEIMLRFSMAEDVFMAYLMRHGEPPLPPYIRREKGAARADAARYQTIYAAHDGSVAAPTAGLHLTAELLAKLKAKNIGYETVTLHVGAGTFMPVKVDELKDHVMHAEWGEITPHVAANLNRAKTEGRRIVAVGTTSLRLLESATDAQGIVHPFKNETKIFIYPGYRFRCVDVLMTNFHLPKSTLFMLVSAFSGTQTMRQAYDYAIAKNFRFYSYGDTTLLEHA